MLKSKESGQSRLEKRSWLRRIEHVAFVGIELILRALPLKAAYLLMESLVRILVTIFPRVKGRMVANLEIAYGNSTSQTKQAELLEKSLEYHAWFIADMLLAPYLMKKARYANAVDTSEVVEALKHTGLYSKQGALLVSSHQGAPDIISLALGKLEFPIAVVARPLDNPYIQKRISQSRKGFNRIQISKTGALRPAYRHLQSKGLLGIQIDQDAGPTGLFVPYFKKLASTHSGPATLACLTKSKVVMVFCIRSQPRSFAFKLITRELQIDEAMETASQDEKIFALTKAMTEEVEVMAKRYPEQVMWAHRRWKTRPADEKMEVFPDAKSDASPPRTSVAAERRNLTA